MRTGLGAGKGLRTGTLAALGVGVALSLAAGCGAPVVLEVEEELLVGEQTYQRMPGSAASVFTHAKKVLDLMGFKIVSVRENVAINARLDSPKRPIHAFLKIRGSDRLYIQLYNLDEEQEEEWSRRLFSTIRASIDGTLKRG